MRTARSRTSGEYLIDVFITPSKYGVSGKVGAVQRTVNPLGLVVMEGISYIVCTIWDYDDIRQLAVHRIMNARLLEEPARRIKGFILDEYIEDKKGFNYPVTSKSIKLRIHIDAGAAWHLTESMASKDQVLKHIDQDNMLLTATVPDTLDLRWWLLGFGDQIEVLAPKSLRAEFKAIAENMARSYQ